MKWRWGALLAPGLLFVPAVRAFTEASMIRYMAGATPLLLWAGYTFADVRFFRRLDEKWNEHGLPAFVVLSSILTVWMIPNALDQATANPSIDAVRTLTHFAAGISLRLGLKRAGLIIQLFFVGHAVTMTIFVGVLFQSLPQRLCNVYLVDDQAQTGVALVILGLIAGALWVWEASRKLGEASAEKPLQTADRQSPANQADILALARYIAEHGTTSEPRHSRRA